MPQMNCPVTTNTTAFDYYPCTRHVQLSRRKAAVQASANHFVDLVRTHGQINARGKLATGVPHAPVPIHSCNPTITVTFNVVI